jgi:HEAT repeat protein
VYLPEGELQAALGGASQTFRGPAVIDVDATGKMTARSGEVMPDWVLERTPPALDSETGRQFARFFREDNPPLANLVEAASADRPDIRRLAFEALGQIGQFSVIVTALSAPEQVETRRAAIDVLRSALAQGGETSRDRLRQELERTGGVEWAELAEQLLVGLVKSAESDPQPALLKLLDHQDVGIRELALDNLMRLSNRGDSLGYNPDDPTPEQIRAWTELLQAPSGRGARGARP